MIHGFDISHHNGKDAVKNCIEKYNEWGLVPEFCMIKASEGGTYIDPMCDKNIVDTEDHGLLYGLYHYARPENNSAFTEAVNFLSVMSNHCCIPVLDWEGKATQYNTKWARDWCDFVYQETGIRPMLYCSLSEARRHQPVERGGYGLWVAAWRDLEKGVGNVSPWKTWAIWQYASRPFDLDVFNGTRQQFLKYCTPDTATWSACHENECDCECHYAGHDGLAKE